MVQPGSPLGGREPGMAAHAKGHDVHVTASQAADSTLGRRRSLRHGRPRLVQGEPTHTHQQHEAEARKGAAGTLLRRAPPGHTTKATGRARTAHDCYLLGLVRRRAAIDVWRAGWMGGTAG